MIKKILGFIFVCSFVFLGSSFVSAGKLQEIGINPSPSSINNQYNITFLKWGGVLSNFLGTSKSVLALDNNKLFWWSIDGRPYFYSPNFQGFFSSYSSCDDLAVAGKPQNCSSLSLTGDYASVFVNFFSKVKQGDYAYYSYESDQGGVNCSYSYQNITVCFSSSEIGKSLCFKRVNCYNGCQNGGSACQNFCNNEGGCGGGLTDSQGFTDLTFGTLHNDWIGYPPGNPNYMNGVGGDIVVSSSNNIPICPTINQLLTIYSDSYNESLCYTPSLIYSGGSLVHVTPKTIFDVFSGSSDITTFRNFRTLYSQNCLYPNTKEHCLSVFDGYSDQYGILSKIPDDVLTADLYQYCRLQLLYPDKNTTTCVGSGVTGGYTGRNLSDIERDLETNSYLIVSPGDTSVAVNVLLTGDTAYTGDIIATLQQIYGKFTSFFTTQTGNTVGIIPNYIISMLLVIILFRLFKK